MNAPSMLGTAQRIQGFSRMSTARVAIVDAITDLRKALASVGVEDVGIKLDTRDDGIDVAAILHGDVFPICISPSEREQPIGYWMLVHGVRFNWPSTTKAQRAIRRAEMEAAAAARAAECPTLTPDARTTR